MRQFVNDQKAKITWLIMILVVVACFSIAISQSGWGWTGLIPYEITTKTDVGVVIETHPGKTLWDVLELVIIPSVLAVGAFLFNRAQSKNEQTIASNQQQEELLQSYIDSMTELILEKRLRDTKEENVQDVDLRNLARSRTLTVLRALDTPNKDGNNRRRGSLIRFLYETQLISGAEPVISLKKANLEEAFMRKSDLRNANLQDTSLYKANLRGANLEGANLVGAYMVKTDLRGANLMEANLNNANLKGCIYGLYRGRPTRWPEYFSPVGTGAIKRDHR